MNPRDIIHRNLASTLFMYVCVSIFAQHHLHRITLKNVELHKLHKWEIIIHYHELENWTNK